MTSVVYRDSARPTSDRVEDLLARMTLDEKVAQLGAVWVNALVADGRFDPDVAEAAVPDGIGQVTRIGGATGLAPAASATLVNAVQAHLLERTRLGIPVIVHEESTGGYCARGATVFPQALALAASFDPDLVTEVGRVIRAQLLAVGARQTLAPVLDIARDPRWGRVEETYGESPVLAGAIGAAYVRGVQGDDLATGVVCTGKHFCGYGAGQGGRNHAPTHMGPRELSDVYAEPFAAAIREAGLASIMHSYSSVDGLPCAGSSAILTDLLRGELGFDGTVVADYWGVTQLHTHHRTADGPDGAAVAALSAGLDVELPALDVYRHLPAAVAEGRLDEALIDRAVRRVLAQKFRLGLFEDPFVDADAAAAVFDTADDRALAHRAAVAGTCLLTNDGVLPLDASRLRRVAVVGPAAGDPRLLQGDYHYPAHVEVFGDLVDDAPAADMLPADTGGSFRPGRWFTPHVTPLAALGERLGPAVELVHVPGCAVGSPDGADDESIGEAVAAASSADVALVFVGERSGLTLEATVGEARDAVSLDLTGAQTDLVGAVAATGTPTVVVVVSGRVHTLGRPTEVASALLWTAPPGEEGGAALADVLLGHHDPGGRLPVTLPRHVGQVPIHHDMRARGDRSEFYGDYADSAASPQFVFGHGMSFTSFVHDDVTVTPGSTSEPTRVEVTVTNVGERPGTDVVQLYARDDVASVARPDRELIGFTRVTLEPGRSSRVAFVVHPSRLAFTDADLALMCEPGRFTFWVGGSSAAVAECTVDLGGPPVTYRRTDIVATVAHSNGTPGEDPAP